MRVSEWIQLTYFVLALGLIWQRRLEGAAGRKAAALGLVGLAAVLLGLASAAVLPPPASSILRDWIPAALIPVAYQLGGCFFSRPNEVLQRRLLALDVRWLGRIRQWSIGESARRAIALYHEVAYLLVYPMVPVGLGVLYLFGMRGHADLYWTTLLVPAYICYGLVAFLPTLPPRFLDDDPVADLAALSGTRRLNLWVLRQTGIGANTFPSAHVAASAGAALALLALVPAMGVVCLWIALSIAAATALGRYHYLADGLVALALCTVWFAVVRVAFTW